MATRLGFEFGNVAGSGLVVQNDAANSDISGKRAGHRRRTAAPDYWTEMPGESHAKRGTHLRRAPFGTRLAATSPLSGFHWDAANRCESFATRPLKRPQLHHSEPHEGDRRRDGQIEGGTAELPNRGPGIRS